VVRASRSPMTNLHLGNARGDVAGLRAVAGPRAWTAALDTCVRVAGLFPGSLHVGVDLMFAPGWRRHAVAEVYAFGDLVPVLPEARWERRHSPASFTYAAHHAFFAGFLPTPPGPGPHPRAFAAAFAGSESTVDGTWVFDAPDVVTALAAAGYHTVCVGGVGFFNKRSALGSVLPALFAESHWAPELGVTNPASVPAQLDVVADVVRRAAGPLFLFLNVSALHQPNRHYLPGSTVDTRESHASALAYVD